MKASVIRKLDVMSTRCEEINKQLSDPEVQAKVELFQKLAIEHGQISPVVALYQRWVTVNQELSELAEISDIDTEMKHMIIEENKALKKEQDELIDDIQLALLPKDPDDDKSIYLEIRAGTGGDEAAIFVGDLFRMYQLYAEHHQWVVDVVGIQASPQGGFKEVVAEVRGKEVFGRMKFEAGTHRVQRVPETESQGRIHTSACTVAVLPKMEEIDLIQINPAELRVDTYRASGAGGQHVNTTDSAVRITHLPTGMVVECQDERSQHKNRAKAMKVIQERVTSYHRDQQRQEQATQRKSMVGSGDRSERIRTYNYPQGRLTDHRIGLTLYRLTAIMDGDLNEVVDALIREDQLDKLSAMHDDAE
ncbi:MAG: peptide chain release factor 1 [Candidatus Comchoanobacterales bacterium]